MHRLTIEQESNETSEKQNEVPDQKRKKKQNEGPGVHCPELDITIVSSGRESLFEGMDLAAEPAPDRIRGDQIRPSSSLTQAECLVSMWVLAAPGCTNLR